MVIIKRRRGFSLLEIMVAMVLFMIVFAAFAMVFPTGFHLNLKSYRTNQSVDLADAILQELASKPVYAPPGDISAGDSLYNLSPLGPLNFNTGWGSEKDWIPSALANFRANNSVLAKEYDYGLPDKTGIQVTFLSGGNQQTELSDNPLVQITTTLQWREVNNGATVPRSVTLTTFVTYDR